MKEFKSHRGVAAAMDRANVDTDQIIPKQFLKRIERTGFGQFLFFDWRFHEDGEHNPEFELNHPHVEGASILVARRNFGSGSSREHAVWALDDYGFRCVIAPSFADIFFNNCFKNGVLPIVLTEEEIDELFERIEKNKGHEFVVDLEGQSVKDDHGLHLTFEIDPHRKESLLQGMDDIGATLQHEHRIHAFEQSRK